ncbi:glycolipid transfer protein [Arapaima gigas]
MALLLEHQFKQLPADRQVETRPFLESVSYLPPFFDCLGSAVFAPIKADIMGNITVSVAISTRMLLKEMCGRGTQVHARMYGQCGKGVTFAAVSARGLRFIQVLLQSLVDGERDENNPNLIRVNATKAYEIALKKYHGWLVQSLFKVGMLAAPYKSDFLKALSKGRDVKEEDCLEKIRQFLVNFTATVDAIYELYTKMNAELDYTV